MKNSLGLFLLTIGVALASAFAARFSPEVYEKQRLKGVEAFHKEATKRAEAALWHALAEATMAPYEKNEDKQKRGQGIEGDAGAKAKATPAAEPKPLPKSLKELQAAIQASVGNEDVGQAAQKLVTAWQAQQTAAKAKPPKFQGLGALVISWASQNGIFFLIGLIILIAGALLMRQAAKEALQDKPQKDGEAHAPARDFGELLSELHDGAEAVLNALKAKTQSDTVDDIQKQIEDLQLDKIEPLVESRGRLQARLGIGGFAEVFGPLSTAERRMNRAWSALVDGHRPEAIASLSGSVPEIDAAKAALERLTAGS